ncbi:hypothetical protein HZB89_00310 [archaeon]|nr:hypothetical protein [archaeon]
MTYKATHFKPVARKPGIDRERATKVLKARNYQIKLAKAFKEKPLNILFIHFIKEHPSVTRQGLLAINLQFSKKERIPKDVLDAVRNINFLFKGKMPTSEIYRRVMMPKETIDVILGTLMKKPAPNVKKALDSTFKDYIDIISKKMPESKAWTYAFKKSKYTVRNAMSKARTA